MAERKEAVPEAHRPQLLDGHKADFIQFLFGSLEVLWDESDLVSAEFRAKW